MNLFTPVRKVWISAGYQKTHIYPPKLLWISPFNELHPNTMKNVENIGKTSLTTSNKPWLSPCRSSRNYHSVQLRKDLAYRISTTSVYKYGKYGYEFVYDLSEV